MRVRFPLLALTLTTCVLPSLGCRLLGFQGNACDPTDSTTCPSGQVCNQKGACVVGVGEGEGEGEGEGGAGGEGEGEGAGEGEGEGGPTVETVVDNQTLVSLLAGADDGSLVWATGATGGCILKKDPSTAGAPSTIHCVAGTESIAGLAVSGTDVYWVVNAAHDDRLEQLPLAASATDTASIYSAVGADVRSVDDGGPNQLAARVSGTDTLVGWFPAPTDFSDIERVIIHNGAVSARAQYGGVGTNPGAVAFSDSNIYWTEDGIYARMMVRDNTVNDGNGAFGAFSDSGNNTTYAHGRGWASTTFGTTAVFTSTRDGSDGGGILKSEGQFDPSFLVVTEVVHQIDPDDAAKYARGLATDGSFLYYTTGGAGLASAPGVFRVSTAAGSVPERLATTDVEGSQILVDSQFITWAEPAANRIVRIPRP